MTDKPTRRDLMRPLHLLGLAFLTAAFAGIVTMVTMGFFQDGPAGQAQRALVFGAIAAGIAFIAVLVIVALLLLAVDPAQVAKPVDRPVLLPGEDAASDDPEARDGRTPPAT
ncbi:MULTISPECIES: amino acid transporter [Microbacterium]|uniref:Amino acid transporter n=1 Tax=Microbacterium wangchenii TaxID=2541726 RepID=A0ABX5SW93_9MICO|nr:MULTISPECIES: amino acid transporter [Microbacterium]MCK6066195.1 amino acid transporter [Microbacterium sp. EYE_512]QBR90468.1 amino acid transporter [Microbacterium wangchenii]TXK14494.1 amino acid transporter [Microbacterium wangchenii]